MLRMGLIGLGGMGRGHLTMIEQLIADGLDVELVALCDIRQERLDNYPKKRHYLDFKEMLEKEEIDILDVALTWIFEGKELNCYELIACLEAKTTLKEKEIRKSLEIIIDIMLKAGKSVCEVKEIDGELDFVILK